MSSSPSSIESFQRLIGLSPTELYLRLSIARKALVELRAEVRESEDRLPIVKARSTNVLVASKGGDEKALGANAEARERAIVLYLAEDFDYLRALGDLRFARKQIEETEATIEDIENMLRLVRRGDAERELESRDRLSDALVRIDERKIADAAAREQALAGVIVG